MAQINIPTSGVWATIAAALNTMFSELFGRTGYVTYNDTQYTVGSPLVIAEGVTVALPNNSLGNLVDQLPTGVTALYNGTRLVSNDNRAAYMIRISFTASNSSQTGSYELTVDISAAGDGSNPILSRSGSFIRGANNPQPISYSELYFSRETFVTNGALIRFTSLAGITSIYNVVYVIAKIHKGRI